MSPIKEKLASLEFSGSNKELIIERFLLNNKFFELNAQINLKDVLSEDIELNTIMLENELYEDDEEEVLLF